jgi:unsaturated rhamnogalacturonyl hydrolase
MRGLILACSTFIVSLVAHGQTQWAVSFADAIMARHPGTIDDMTKKGWEYSNSIVLHGIEKVYYATGEDKYLNYVQKYVDKFVGSNGIISDFEPETNNLDKLHPGLLCLFLYQETGLEKYKLAADKVRAEFDNQPRNPSGGFWHKERYPNQMWVDGIYMAQPFLVKYGNMFGDAQYCLDEASEQTLMLAEQAYDPSVQLLVHGWDETKKATWADTQTGLSPSIWSRGMGWYAMALVDILKHFPESHESHDSLVDLLGNVAEGLKNSQDKTSGLWYQVMDKADSTGNFEETSGSGMFVYTIKTAIDMGYIDTSYMDVVRKGWKGLQTHITLDNLQRPVFSGFVGGMGIFDKYEDYVAKTTVTSPPSHHPHGYCAVLMAAASMELKELTQRYSFELNVDGMGKIESEITEGAYLKGRDIKLKAIADTGYEFAYWNNDPTLNQSNSTFELDSNMTITAHFILKGTASVDGVENENQHIYPNPFGEQFMMPLEGHQPVDIQIWNTNGILQPVHDVAVENGQIMVDTRGLTPGVFLVRVFYHDKITLQKVVKN